MVPLGLLHIFFSLNSLTRASSGVMVAHLMPTPLACHQTIRVNEHPFLWYFYTCLLSFLPQGLMKSQSAVCQEELL